MKLLTLFPVFVFLIITGCKTKQVVVNDRPSKRTQTTVSGQSATNTQYSSSLEGMQKDVSPEPELVVEEEMVSTEELKYLDTLAANKAALVCKKRKIQQTAGSGKTIEQGSMDDIDKRLSMLETEIAKATTINSLANYFNQKCKEYLKNCNN